MDAFRCEVVPSGWGPRAGDDEVYACIDGVADLGRILEAIKPPLRPPDPIRW